MKTKLAPTTRSRVKKIVRALEKEPKFPPAKSRPALKSDAEIEAERIARYEIRHAKGDPVEFTQSFKSAAPALFRK